LQVQDKLKIFTGGTGGIDSWLTSDRVGLVFDRLSSLSSNPLSCSQLNQLLAISHQAEVSSDFFQYYWSSEPLHPYDVTRLPDYDPSYKRTDKILSLDQLSWGLQRIYRDTLLFFRNIREGYGALRSLDKQSLERFFTSHRFNGDGMRLRGPCLPFTPINQDDRYLIAEQACKSFEPTDDENGLELILRGAWAEHSMNGGGTIKVKQLLEGAYIANGFAGQQKQFIFAADEILDEHVTSEADLLEKYNEIAMSFGAARKAALSNTELYLSIANDLDVYVATSMRSRQDFRNVAKLCQSIFNHAEIAHLKLRYFDPTMSAAKGHEDKGLIECLMVKCAKALVYVAGSADSYGKDAEAAMALSLGKPVIFVCDEKARQRFFTEIHPLSRLIDFSTGVAVGAMATDSWAVTPQLLGRIFENRMEYDIEQPKKGYYRLKERLTGSTVRLQTNDVFLRETFWNCYHRPSR
jgi:hypothetical protein